MSLLKNSEWGIAGGYNAEPPQVPVTALDIDREAERGVMYDMMLPMADPCPECGAFNMRVGDYVCFGICNACLPDPEF